MTNAGSSPPVDIPVAPQAPQSTYNTPIQSSATEAQPGFPFGAQHDPYSRAVDLSQLSRRLHKVEVSRLGDDLAYALSSC